MYARRSSNEYRRYRPTRKARGPTCVFGVLTECHRYKVALGTPRIMATSSTQSRGRSSVTLEVDSFIITAADLCVRSADGMPSVQGGLGDAEDHGHLVHTK